MSRRLLYRSDWALQIKRSEELSTSFEDSISIIPPLYTWWADPQLAYKDGEYYIFIEEKSRAEPKGHISVIRVDDQDNWTGPVRVLETPYHLSYPFVFFHEGAFYMVPESSHNRTIDLYEAEDFPWKWKLKKTIMSDVEAFDSTLIHKDDRWWLFCTIAACHGDSCNDRLHLFFSEDLLSNHWESHPLNPIVSDPGCARPAGAIFEQDGGLYRPSQDCATCYGYGISINKIEELSEKSYKEKQFKYIAPKWDRKINRVHTINHLRDLTVVDVYLERSRWRVSK